MSTRTNRAYAVEQAIRTGRPDVITLAREIESYLDESKNKPATPDEADTHTIALVGNPDNKTFAIKTTYGFWRTINDGRQVDPEVLERGWVPQ